MLILSQYELMNVAHLKNADQQFYVIIEVTSGPSQDSILTQMVFNIFINDMKKMKVFIKSADDTKLDETT